MYEILIAEVYDKLLMTLFFRVSLNYSLLIVAECIEKKVVVCEILILEVYDKLLMTLFVLVSLSYNLLLVVH